jgi:hypothetical protein
MYKNDKKHGPGKLTFAGGKASYDGIYNEDKMDGYGVFRFDDGDVYEGQWKNDMKHGHGKYTGKNNEVYIGDWKNNLQVMILAMLHNRRHVFLQFYMFLMFQHGHGKFSFFNGDKCKKLFMS